MCRRLKILPLRRFFENNRGSSFRTKKGDINTSVTVTEEKIFFNRERCNTNEYNFVLISTYSEMCRYVNVREIHSVYTRINMVRGDLYTY